MDSTPRTPHPALVHVVLPRPVDQAYTYAVPDALAGDAQVGCRVLVEFGRRRLTGMIVAHELATPTFEVKPLLDVLDDIPAFTDEQLRLTRWIADYYVCAWGEAVKAALPAGIDVEERCILRRTQRPPGEWADHTAARAALHYLDAHENATLAGLRQQVDHAPLALLRRLERAGLIEITEELSVPKVRVKHETHLRLAPAFREPAAARDLRQQLPGKKQRAVVEAMTAFAGEGDTTPRQADVLARADASTSTVRRLIEMGLVEAVEEEVLRIPNVALDVPTTPLRRLLHPAQQQALQKIREAIDAGRFETFLLHGVTGSGKTEVYIAALKAVLARGQTGIILVPEIALTPQTVQRFRAHFGDRIAVLHSRMSLGERYDAWRSLRSGRFDVVIGPRSAILAPLSNVGLIVVDEEHEPSYKQFDPAPRYHARDVAVLRASLNDAVCILGSATPSLESFQNARQGKYTLLRMPVRVPVPGWAAAPLPPVALIDLGLEYKKHRLDGAISGTLGEAIEARLSRKEQVILLQNRRGYAPIVECQACGFVPRCFDCSVTMTYHKSKRQLRCHYCGRTQTMLHACPQCGSSELSRLGQGTQRVEEELAQCFPNARILRMDLDTTGRKDAHHTILSRFGRGEADLLVGTQMVAKGLDFPRVTLVGVVNADVGMGLPDFRAEERTFQLLTQVAGRAGRADLPGEVLVQTRNPGHPVFRHVLSHDYDAFAQRALEERELFDYPPFGRMAGIEFRGPNEEAVAQLARDWTAVLAAKLRGNAGVEVLGPEPAFIGRIKRQYRYHTLVKAPRARTALLQEVLRATALSCGNPPRRTRLAIDIDPIGLF